MTDVPHEPTDALDTSATDQPGVPTTETADSDPSAADAPGVPAADLDRIAADFDGVDAALRRLDDGTYWTDEVTGAPIPDDALAADPVARRATT